MVEDIKVINLGFVNAFLVHLESGFVLVDTGVAQHWPKLENALIEAGCQPDNLKLVVITHGDQDHVGNCATLQRKYGVKIAMHKGDQLMVESDEKTKRTVTNPIMRLFFSVALFFMKLSKSSSSFPKFKPDILLTDGQSLKEFGWNAKVIGTPGHTKGSIVILTEEGSLFAGDTLNNMFKPDVAPIVEDFSELKGSLEIIKKLKIETVYPGHGKPFPPTLIQQFSVKN